MTTYLTGLGADRLEEELADKKPTYSQAEARAEAERCLYCADAPCIKACPTEIDIPTFIRKIATGNEIGSARTIFAQNILGASCSRVCPVEELCEGACVYAAWQREPIAIGRLQRYATERATAEADSSPARLLPRKSPAGGTGKRVALVGAGPASLACAAELALSGHSAVIFEKRSVPGGLNTYGIAPYKLKANDAIREIEWIARLGVEFRTGVEIGKDVQAAELVRTFDAVFLGVGLGGDKRLGVPGEDGANVVGATAWIERMKLGRESERPRGNVVVIGGGNTAVDAAREAKLLGGANVTLAYRRGESAMSAYEHEVAAGRIEGVVVVHHARPLAFVRDAAGALRAIRFARADSASATGAAAEFEIPCELALIAIGQSSATAIARQFEGVKLDASGCIVVDPANGATSNPNVFSGGDCVNGGKEVVNAVADGRNAARWLIAKWGVGAKP